MLSDETLLPLQASFLSASQLSNQPPDTRHNVKMLKQHWSKHSYQEKKCVLVTLFVVWLTHVGPSGCCFDRKYLLWCWSGPDGDDLNGWSTGHHSCNLFHCHLDWFYYQLCPYSCYFYPCNNEYPYWAHGTCQWWKYWSEIQSKTSCNHGETNTIQVHVPCEL